MKILIISASADSAGIWWRFRKEGHRVLVYFTDPEVKDSMEGVVEPVTLNQGLDQKPDFIWADMVGNGELCDRLRKAGLPIFGGSKFCDDIELKRDYGMQVMKQAGIQTPKTVTFKKLEECMAFAKSNPKFLVTKVNGNVSAASSFVADDQREMVEYLEFLRESADLKGATFLLQEKIKGVEISTEIVMCDGRVLYPLESTLEEKKLMEGNKGPNTGAMSSVVFPYLTSSPRIAQQTVLKMVPMLKAMKFSGFLDCNAIVSEENHQSFCLEFTARAGYDALYALAAMIDTPLADFFNEVAHGTAKRLPLSHTWGVALRLIIPPAPSEWPDLPEVSKKAYAAIAGQPVKIPDDKYIYPIEELGKDKKGRWITKGIDGTVAEACATGSDITKVWEEAKKRWEQIKVPSAMGRFDGIKRVTEDLAKLRAWGYETPNIAKQEVKHAERF